MSRSDRPAVIPQPFTSRRQVQPSTSASALSTGMRIQQELENALPPASPRPTPSFSDVSERAYRSYLEEGCVQGRDLEHWLKAERQLLAEYAFS